MDGGRKSRSQLAGVVTVSAGREFEVGSAGGTGTLKLVSTFTRSGDSLRRKVEVSDVYDISRAE